WSVSHDRRCHDRIIARTLLSPYTAKNWLELAFGRTWVHFAVVSFTPSGRNIGQGCECCHACSGFLAQCPDGVVMNEGEIACVPIVSQIYHLQRSHLVLQPLTLPYRGRLIKRFLCANCAVNL